MWLIIYLGSSHINHKQIEQPSLQTYYKKGIVHQRGIVEALLSETACRAFLGILEHCLET